MRKVCLLAMVALTVFGVTVQQSRAAVIVADDGSGWTVVSGIYPAPDNTDITSQDQSSVHGSGVPGGTSTGVELDGAATGPSSIFDDLVYEVGDMATGGGLNMGSVFGVEIDFYTGSTSYNPQTLSLYFQTFDGFSWYYNLAAPSSAGWNSYTLILPSSYGGWYSPDGGTSFSGSLADGVTRAGLRFVYPTSAGPFEYGIGNFEYHDSDSYYIPEPGTYMMLSTALMSLGYTFARRRREQKKVA